MNITRNVIRAVSLLPLLLTMVSCSLVENKDNTQIHQIDDFYPIRNQKQTANIETYNVLDTVEKTKCGPARVMISPKSLGIKPEKFDELWSELRKNSAQKRFYKFTYGECVDDGVFVTKIIDCSSGRCGKEYAIETDKVWLSSRGNDENEPGDKNSDYYVVGQKRYANYFIQLPLKQIKKDRVWALEIRYVKNPESIAFKGYINSDDFEKGRFILDYKAYYLSGNLYSQGVFSLNGVRDGSTVAYFDRPDSVRFASQFSNGKMNGDVFDYYKNGQLRLKRSFVDGKDITQNGLIFDEQGKIIAKYSHNALGNPEGLFIEYYSDGTVKQRAHYVNGEIVGKKEAFWPNGRLKSRKTYKNAQRISEALWYENGRKQEERFYNEAGGKIGLHKQWYANGKLSARESFRNGTLEKLEAWHENGRLYSREIRAKGKRVSQETWYQNGRLRSKQVYKNDRRVSDEEWYQNGKRSERTLYKNGRRTLEERYNSDGKLTYRSEYFNRN